MISFSVITAKKPEKISKGFFLEDGQLQSIKGGDLISGQLQTIAVTSIADVATTLQELQPDQAVAWGTCKYKIAEIATNGYIKKSQRSCNSDGIPLISRTRKNFAWPDDTAILMLDYDGQTLAAQELLDALYAICPEIKTAPHLVKASASSFIYHGNEELKGAAGWRVLIAVKAGDDIQRAGKVLWQRAWLAGHGYIKISRSGCLLERSLIDASVWQPERLDFCGGAFCRPPLSQLQPEILVFYPDAPPLDTSTALQSLDGKELKKLARLINAEKAKKKPEARLVEDDYIEKKVKEIRAQSQEIDPAIVKDKYSQAVKNCMLLGNFELLTQCGKKITVAEILKHREQYHETRFADPLEPEYNGDDRIAWANLLCETPYLWSHAHGKRKFTLHACTKEIRVVAGRKREIIAELIELLRISGKLYERGGELVTIKGKQIIQVDVDALHVMIDSLAVWSRWNAKLEKWSVIDAPKTYAVGIFASKHLWHFHELDNIITAPTIAFPEMRLISRPGYDEQSKLFLHVEGEVEEIDTDPDQAAAKAALETLWQPFRLFPFTDDISRGVFLSAILTACVRQSLPTAPGFLITSPTAGSGKSILGACLGILAGENYPAVLPMLKGKEKGDEIRKRLLSVGRAGSQVVTLDNLTGSLESDALCSWLTSEQYEDRLLGSSQKLVVSTKLLFLLNGNNVQMVGDLCRRVLVCRIDPGVEKPYKRAFPFCPKEACREDRQKMIAAGIQLIYYANKHMRELSDRTASFELWSDFVRRAVCGWQQGFADPIDSIDLSYSVDSVTQKLATLQEAVAGVFGHDAWTVAELIAFAESNPANAISERLAAHENLKNALEEVAGMRGEINRRVLGRWLEKHADRIINGLALRRAGKTSNKVLRWQVLK